MKKNSAALIVLVAGSLLLIAVLTIATPKPGAERHGPSDITMMIDFGGQAPDTVPVNQSPGMDWNMTLHLDNATVYSALQAASEKFNFTFKADWYPNFQSHRVSEIAGVHDGTDNRYWQYYVNGVYMTKGADLVGLSDGDSVRWEFRSAMQ